MVLSRLYILKSIFQEERYLFFFGTINAWLKYIDTYKYAIYLNYPYICININAYTYTCITFGQLQSKQIGMEMFENVTQVLYIFCAWN